MSKSLSPDFLPMSRVPKAGRASLLGEQASRGCVRSATLFPKATDAELGAACGAPAAGSIVAVSVVPPAMQIRRFASNGSWLSVFASIIPQDRGLSSAAMTHSPDVRAPGLTAGTRRERRRSMGQRVRPRRVVRRADNLRICYRPGGCRQCKRAKDGAAGPAAATPAIMAPACPMRRCCSARFAARFQV